VLEKWNLKKNTEYRVWTRQNSCRRLNRQNDT
jgi:hypothetical protein